MMMRAYVAGAVVLLIAAVTGCFGPKRAEVADLAPPAVPPCTAPAAALTMSPPPRALTQQAASSNAPGRPSVLRGAVRRAAIRAHQAPATQPSEADSPAALPPRAIEMLCLSGGGQHGAFGAGFLAGWSKAQPPPRARPSFDVVTGISTGSLISTFAFLGPSYDDRLERAYLDATVGTPIFKTRFLLGFLLADSLATRHGLEQRIQALITPQLLTAVAQSTAGGQRSLLVGTVNLDSGRMTFWNLSRIAELGVELERTSTGRLAEATVLYRTILLAATAIPGALPPVLIDRDRFRPFFEHDATCAPIVQPDWGQHATMHCDGGARQNIFAVDLVGSLTSLHPPVDGKSAVNVYLIANGTMDDGQQVTSDSVVPIGTRAVSLLLSEAMRGNIATIALLGRKHNWNVRLAFLKLTDACAKLQPAGGLVDPFDGPFMRCIMAEGEARGASSDDQVRWNSLEDLGLPE
jgi:predicted acylesterase/phospholipase RssA